MCGIVGYFGKRSAQEFLLEGLKRLEYRGYDSAGVALIEKGKLKVTRSVGKVSALEERLGEKVSASLIGIAHTRWATHGKPSKKNAHPHIDCAKQVAVVHNGIIENYRELKEELERQGHIFRSETDTEIIAHVLEEEMKESSFEEAFVKTLKRLRGAYAIVALSVAHPKVMLAARFSSPLVLGIGDGELFLASDVSALVGDVKRVVYLDDSEMVVLGEDGYVVKTLANQRQKKKEVLLECDRSKAERGGFPHFMLKEIFEQPKSFADALRGRLLPEEGRARLGGCVLWRSACGRLIESSLFLAEHHIIQDLPGSTCLKSTLVFRLKLKWLPNSVIENPFWIKRHLLLLFRNQERLLIRSQLFVKQKKKGPSLWVL